MSDDRTSKNVSNSAQAVLNMLSKGEKPRDMQDAMDMLFELAGQVEQDQNYIDKLGKLAITKELTGLLNKRGFQEEIEKEENRVNRGQSIGGVVLNIDLAGFKRINDTYGEKAGGDVALRVFGEHMRKFGFRDIDILANPGGDEFFVILTNTKIENIDYHMDHSQPLDAFKAVCSDAQNVLLKVEKFMRDGRIISFEGVDKHGEPFTDIMRARITCEQYGDPKQGQSSLNQALEKSELPTTLLKKFTKNYVIGGR